MRDFMKKNKENYAGLSALSFILILFTSLLFVCGYTYVLQKMENESILSTHISENKSRTDAMYEGTQSLLTVEDFTNINTTEDMNTATYTNLQSHLNEIRNMNSTRYFYTAKRNSEGKLIYVVDGLDLGASDFAYPGTYIEDEMIPYIERALNGEFVYSQDIIDTDWGHIFTACYPIRSESTQEIIGALCIEMDMEQTYTYINERNTVATNASMIGVAIVFVMMTIVAVYFARQRKYRISQNRKLQEAASAAQSSDRAKSTFLFNMSHDIRTPMNAIIGYIDLARKHIDEPDKLNTYMDNIEYCGQNLLSLLNNVLDLARIESDKIVIEETALNVEELTYSNVSMFYNDAKKKNQTITLNSHIRHPNVYADDVHISEIIMNIISNAIKYTGDEGSITVDVYQEESKTGWCNTIYSITDTGIGMSEEYQTHLFEMFSRERSTTKSGVEGVGLGMSIVKKLVDLMNGQIHVKSKLGQGTTFTISIPMRIAKESDLQVKKANPEFDKSDLAGKRILLTEDNDLNAEIAMELLETEGFVVERAGDGVVCVEMMEKQPAGYYDMILMDIQMPIMDGYMATQKIRRLDDKIKASIPIVAMTANAFAEDKERAIQSGMNDHVAKPIDMNILLKTIHKYI